MLGLVFPAYLVTLHFANLIINNCRGIFVKKLIYVAMMSALVAGCQQSETVKEPAAEKANPQTDIEKQSYALGAMSSSRLASDEMLKSLNLDQAMLVKGFADGLKDSSIYNEDELRAELGKLQQSIQSKQMEKIAAEAQPEKERGAEHIAKLKAEDDTIKTTESGLSYKVLTESENDEKPTAEDTVKVHYTGTLVDGTQFDSSVDRGEPIEFPLNGVIAGWTEGVQMMDVGDKYRFYIPSDLAYGDQGRPGAIPGGATLIFDVELLAVNPGQEEQAEAEEKTENK